MSRVKVTKSHPPETTEILAEAIVRISEHVEKLERSGLNRTAIIILLSHATKVGKKQVIAVLDGLKQLRGWYCRD